MKDLELRMTVKFHTALGAAVAVADDPDCQCAAAAATLTRPKACEARGSGDLRRAADLAASPQTMTILTQSRILDSGKTDLEEIRASQAGVTPGSGENGNAFGDRYIIRGHEARSDVFVDGVRTRQRRPSPHHARFEPAPLRLPGIRANLLHADEQVLYRAPVSKKRVGGLISRLWQELLAQNPQPIFIVLQKSFQFYDCGYTLGVGGHRCVPRMVW